LKKSLFSALACALIAGPLAAIALPGPASAAVVTEGFDTVPPGGWTTANNSSPVGTTTVFQGNNTDAFDAHMGVANAYAAMNVNSTSGYNGTISTWLVTPQYSSLSNGDVVSFYTRKPTIGGGQTDFPDRLEVRMSTNGSCSPGTGVASVGDFVTLLTSVNPSLAVGGYPQSWTQYSVTLAGIPGTKSGCFAFRYHVTDSGLWGANGDYIGIDTYAYDDQPTDVTPPNTTITSGPGATTNDSTPTFEFSSSETGSTFECRLDAGAFSPCTSPVSIGASDGPHTFEVRARDAAGNTDPTPASASFTVDSTAPETTITSAPDATTGDSTPTFEFGSSETGSTFACRLDDAAFSPCSSPVTTAAQGDGPHTFEVRATDQVGNTDPTPASASFTVDTTAPETTITAGPGAATADTTPSFMFDSSEAGSSFECSIDSGGFGPCASGVTIATPDEGAHVFEVRATDQLGHTDPTPASASFTVDTTAPATTITSAPGATTEDSTPTFAFSSSEVGSAFACSVDGAEFASCSGPGAAHTTAVLPVGSHTFAVRATDTAGNTDATPALSTFSVVAPTLPPADCSALESAVAKAKGKIAKTKGKLKKAKESGNAKAIKKAKAKVKKAKQAHKAAVAALGSCQAG
jgi:hypothetical protein